MSEELQQPVDDESGSLNAGFAKVRGDEPPAEVKPEPVEPVEVVAAVEPEPEPEPDEIEKFRGETTKNIEKIYGKFGEIQRTLQQLQAKPVAQATDNTEALGRIKEEFPELAELLIPAIAGRAGPSTNVDEVVSQRVNEALQKQEVALEQRLLRKDHKDADAIINSERFVEWLRQQPAEVQTEISTTNNADTLSEGLTKFKTWRDAADNAQKAASEQHRRKQARLEGAITPTGVAAARPSKLPDEAGLSAGFNKVRRTGTPERLK